MNPAPSFLFRHILLRKRIKPYPTPRRCGRTHLRGVKGLGLKRRCGVNIIFVAGTDTGVGKTIVTGLLSRYLLEKGYRVVTQKWIQTGCRSSSGDIDIHLNFMRKKKEEFGNYLPLMMPYTFKFASSPHLAASLEKKRINILKVKESLKTLCEHFDFVIVEGIGGLLVPLNSKELLIDVVEELNLPVLVVAGNRLGVINHTLLSIEALKTRDIKILGIIFNNILKDEKALILKDNPKIVNNLTGITVLGILPWANNPYQLQKRFTLIGNKIVNQYG